MQPPPLAKDLVLLGGGHSHVEALRRLAMRPVDGVRVTLLSESSTAFYSGMLPGLVAGSYAESECVIDLMRLAVLTGARFIRATATGIECGSQRVALHGRPPIRYDVLSINVGSTPSLCVQSMAGTEATPTGDLCIPVKPVAAFLAAWTRLLAAARLDGYAPRIAVVGGGLGGIELAMAMVQRLRAELPNASPQVTLVSRGRLLASGSARGRALLARALVRAGVEVLEKAEVVAVEPGALALADGPPVRCDVAFWATEATAPAWIAAAGLATDARGFLLVDSALCSVSHPNVLGAGDVVMVRGHPRERSGVQAVRQGGPLADSLRRILTGGPPRTFVPQRHALALVGTGMGTAIALRGRWLALEGRWLWRLKQRIDRRWIGRVQATLRGMAERKAAPAGAEAMRCNGCAAKLPAPVLRRALRRLGAQCAGGPGPPADFADDAAIVSAPPGATLLQTIDGFRAIVDDPHLFGRIAANHAMGDIWAMGGRPLHALALAGLPVSAPDIQEEDLLQMLSGADCVLRAAGAYIAGGHSAETAEPTLGLAITGVAGARVLRKSGLRAGDRLALTKPLGIGALFAAHMRGSARADWMERAIESMLASSSEAAACLVAHGASAMTDVTGFGLAGHLLEMLQASDAAAVLDMASVPALAGALEVIASGQLSSLHAENRRACTSLDAGRWSGTSRFELLLDPQTSGGLLAGLPADRAGPCLAALRASGQPLAAIIGKVVPRGAGPTLRLD